MIYVDKGPSQWKWLLVPPAFVGGFIPGLLARISWEFGTSWIPGVEFLMDRWAVILQSGMDGYFAVFFAAVVAPRGTVITSIVAALFVSVVSGMAIMLAIGEGSLWNSALIIVTIIGAGIAVWHRIEKERTEKAEREQRERWIAAQDESYPTGVGGAG